MTERVESRLNCGRICLSENQRRFSFYRHAIFIRDVLAVTSELTLQTGYPLYKGQVIALSTVIAGTAHYFASKNNPSSITSLVNSIRLAKYVGLFSIFQNHLFKSRRSDMNRNLTRYPHLVDLAWMMVYTKAAKTLRSTYLLGTLGVIKAMDGSF